MQNRRVFSLSLLATSLAGTAGLLPDKAQANTNSERGVNLPSALKLKYLPQVDISTLPTVLAALSGRPGGGTLQGLIRWPGQGNRADLYDLTSPLPVANEDRSSLLNPTIEKQFSGAQKIGSLYLSGDPAIIYVDEEPGLPGPDALVHESYSYELPSRPKKAEFRIPTFSNLPVVGAAFAKQETGKKRRTLIVLTPTIVTIR